MIVTGEELSQIHRQAESEYPYECCGVILTGAGATRLLMRCRNIQDQLHADDPVAHPRDARTGYNIAPQDLLKIGRLESEGYEVSVIYHSHIEAGAYFSETDKRNALLDGEPTYPSATYIVCSVMGGRVADTKAYRWNGTDFQTVPLGLLQ